MNELLIRQDALDLLPSQDAKQFIKDKFEGRPIRSIETNQCIDLIMPIIQNGIKNLGHWANAADAGILKHLAKGVISAIVTAKEFKKGKSTYDLRNITIEELTKAISEGTQGNYKRKDEIITANVESLLYWAQCYLTDTARRASIYYYNLLLSQEKPKIEPTPEEQEEIIREGSISAYYDFLIDQRMPSTPRVIYDFLWKTLKIEWSPLERKQIETEAESICRTEINNKRISGNISSIIHKQQLEGISNSNKLGLEKKRIALRRYFEKISQDVTINDFKNKLYEVKA